MSQRQHTPPSATTDGAVQLFSTPKGTAAAPAAPPSGGAPPRDASIAPRNDASPFGRDQGGLSPQAEATAPLLSHWADAPPVQRRGDGPAPQAKDTHKLAEAGVSEGGGALPHLDRIQAAFGKEHDLSQIRAHTGGAAAQASRQMGAEGYATGNRVAFKESPSLHVAAHEAAHVVQQRSGVSLKGGVGEAGDAYERHADAVADAVVAGKSAAPLLGPGGSGADKGPVQFYKQVGGTKVADDDEAMLEGRQTLYASADRIKEANTALKGVGKHGSFIQLAGNKTKKHKGKSLSLVLPRWVPQGANAGEHAGAEKANKPGTKDSTGAVTGGRGFALWTDCGRSSSAVTGSQNTGDRSVVYNDNGAEKKSHGKANDGSVEDWLDTVPGGMANEIFFVLMPKFIAKPENAAFLKAGVHFEGKVEDKKWKTPATILEAKQMYAALTGPGRDKFDKEAGINHYANPNIGEAYSMATEGQMPGFHETSDMTWNYHWAGVIMKAGGDNITLENFAVTEETAKKYKVDQYDFIDHDWNFDMYGTVNKDQTFHHDHLESDTHGSHATSIRVQSDK